MIVLDGSPASEPRDCDRDGFEETIVIGLEDAGRIVAKDAEVFYDKVKARVGDWQLKAAGTGTGEGPRSGSRGDGGGPAASVTKPDPSGAKAEAPAPPVLNPVAAVGGDVAPPARPMAGNGIRLAVGRSERTFEAKEFSLAISDTRLNQLNMGVVGDLGTGKTQLLKSLVYQIVSSAMTIAGYGPGS